MKKLYVGNISYKMGDADLKDLFSQFGEVASASVVIDRVENRSRGFGFVEMNDADAMNAIEKLNGQEHEGRALVVNEARPKEDRPRNGGGNFRR